MVTITPEDMIVLTKDGTPYPAHHIKEPIKIYDPRPTCAVAPYYYPLPSAECLAAIGNGDEVEVKAADFEGETTRIRVVSADAESIQGTVKHTSLIAAMDGFPDPGIIQVPKTHIVEVHFATPNKHARKARIRPRRCLELCVADETLMWRDNPILYVYRDRPFQVRKGTTYPDSGWRILCIDEEMNISAASLRHIVGYHLLRYADIGNALVWDDSWIHLIDQPIGSAFVSNPATGFFSKAVKPPSGLITPDLGFSLSSVWPLPLGRGRNQDRD
jgi:hypothetical protein